MRIGLRATLVVSVLVSASCTPAERYDVIIRGGLVYDGSGSAPQRVDVAIRGDEIAALGDLRNADASHVVDAPGLAVAPGFINMLSWANESLIHDGRSQSDIRQGVTLEVMGEGDSMGPLNPAMKKVNQELQGDIKYDITDELIALSREPKMDEVIARVEAARALGLQITADIL